MWWKFGGLGGEECGLSEERGMLELGGFLEGRRDERGRPLGVEFGEEETQIEDEGRTWKRSV